MSPVNETVTRLHEVGGVPESARVVLRYHNGVAGQERELGLTFGDLVALAAVAGQDKSVAEEPRACGAVGVCIECADEYSGWLLGIPRNEYVNVRLQKLNLARAFQALRTRHGRAMPKVPKAGETAVFRCKHAAGPNQRTDDRRESDRHPPRPL